MGDPPYQSGMFRRFRATLEALQGIAAAIEDSNEIARNSLEGLTTDAHLSGRVDELERARGKWEADVEAVFLKADAKLKASNNAESRARTMLNHAEKFAPEDRPEGEEGIEPEPYEVYGGDAEGVEEAGVQPVHVGVEISPKARAMRHKFG